jgi:hypothetical protein
MDFKIRHENGRQPAIIGTKDPSYSLGTMYLINDNILGML